MKNQLITSQILDFFGSHQHFLITAARNFDGDAIGSTWAIAQYLRSIGKTVTLANSLPLARVYHFLGCSKEIVQDFDESGIDAVIICDTGSIAMLDELYKNHQHFFESTPTLNIDHHFAHCPFGSLCLLDPAATSTCNIVYDLLVAHAGGNTHCITPEIATALLLGIIYDTNCYKNNNSRASDFRLTAQLIECGGVYYPTIIEYYRRRPLHHFQLYGSVLAHVTTRANGRVIFGWITQDLLKKYDIGENEGGNMFINDFLTSIEGDIFLCITECALGGYKISLRSKTERYDVSALAQQYFEGGGHKCSSGGTCTLTKSEIEDIVHAYWIRCQ